MKQALQGKVVVITGGNSGIGLASAKRFVAEGAFVFINGRRQAELDKAVNEIGKNVVAVKSDVSKPEDLDHIYKEVAAEKGKIDILFANAGIVETVETHAATPEHFDRTFNTNARGAYFTVQKALPLLRSLQSLVDAPIRRKRPKRGDAIMMSLRPRPREHDELALLVTCNYSDV